MDNIGINFREEWETGYVVARNANGGFIDRDREYRNLAERVQRRYKLSNYDMERIYADYKEDYDSAD